MSVLPKSLPYTLLLPIAFMILSCGDQAPGNKESPENISENQNIQSEEYEWDMSEAETEWSSLSYEGSRKKLPPFDLNMDLSDKTIEELRILRNTLPARYGYLFTKADLRYYFYNTPWYRDLMEARWYGECEYSGVTPAPPIEYTPEESAFLEKVKKLEEEKRKENYLTIDGLKYANLGNIINKWQYNQLPGELLNALGKNGFAIVPNKNVQLFHLYEQNDYSQTQNFVTTDLYLQLFHMHFSFMLRGLEEDQFSHILQELTAGIQYEAWALSRRAEDINVINAAEYNAALYAVPAMILNAKDVLVPKVYNAKVATERINIDQARATTSALIPAYSTFYFPYDLFSPRGHYTRNDKLKQYFKAMQWLQCATYCFDDKTDLSRAVIAAYTLNNGESKSGTPLKTLYRSIMEPTSFLIGKPDNVSLMDLCELVGKRKTMPLADLLKEETLTAIGNELKTIAEQKNVIKPKVENTCRDKLNFMPARFVLDNEILQEMTDIEYRRYPKGLDIMAAFGSKAAKDILVNEFKETEKWDEFLPKLDKMHAKYANYEDWDASVYNKWIQGLNAILKPDEKYPYFMQLPAWNRKNLNTALASWTELKHDAALYTEQPSGAECGGGGECDPPPEPYVVGYVEPNVNYWKQALELLDLTEKMLDRNNLLDNKLKRTHADLQEMCAFLLKVSEKELKGENLSEQEYNTIEKIGSSVDYLTLSIMDVYDWSAVTSADREIAVVADVYTNNTKKEPGILTEAVGFANDIYVLVEIEGYLYITKGATFSYYEFPVPLNERMTDEEWQEMLKKGETVPVPPWMEKVIIILDKDVKPLVKEFLYTSGC